MVNVENFPWLFFGKGRKRNCSKWMMIFARNKIIPNYCRHYCWKVIISLSSLSDLVNLSECLKEKGYLSKCGVDRRPYTKDKYVGFIYCGSLSEAQQRKEEFDGKVRITRGCTEMRMDIEESSWDEVMPFDMEFEDDFVVHQSSSMRKAVINNWTRWEKENEV